MEFREGIIDQKTMAQARTGKPYCIFTVDGKKYSSFDEKVYNAFNIGQAVKIGGEQEGQYWNMKTMMLLDKPVETVKVGVPQEIKVPNRNTTMYVSYAKDIFCASMEQAKSYSVDDAREVMKQAINLVKQAKEAFE